jgi:heterodisulfide reductase subunit A
MAVSRAKLLRPLQRNRVDIVRTAMVLGGGISGMQCAIDIARQGIKVYLVEHESELGGQLRNLDRLFPAGARATDLVETKKKEIEDLGIGVFLSQMPTRIEGFVGNFTVALGDEEIPAGAIVLATGGTAMNPAGRMGHGRLNNVITSSDFEKTLAADEAFDPEQHIVFVQCVGSREEDGYTGCSRFCCQVSLKQALEASRRGARTSIIHRDIRAFTRFGEDLYREARSAGIQFLRCDDPTRIRVEGNGDADSIVLFDDTLLSEVRVSCSLVVLAVPMLASGTTKATSEMLRVPLGKDGFFLEKHVKLGPLETNTEGIFLCGCSQYPKDIADSLAQASGVAAKVGALLSKSYVTLEPATAMVSKELCRACGTCVTLCEYHAPTLVKEDGWEYVVINEALCKGCGTCAAYCPSNAITAKHFTDDQIETMIDNLFTG